MELQVFVRCGKNKQNYESCPDVIKIDLIYKLDLNVSRVLA